MTEIATDSRMAMWEAAAGLAHTDGKLTAEEEALLKRYFNRLTPTPEQQERLEHALYHGVDVETVLPRITDMRDAAHLINMARVIFHADGYFDLSEQRLLEKMHARHMQHIDLDQALAEARKTVEKEKARQEDNETAHWFSALLDYIDIFDFLD